MSKCRYCKVELPGDWRDSEHRKICKNLDAETRYIHSGIKQKEYPPKEGYAYNRETGKSELKAGN